MKKTKEELSKMKQYKGFCVDEDFSIYNADTGRMVSAWVGNDGYMQVSRRAKCNDGRQYHLRVRRIFAELFIDNPNNYDYVNHIDSNKTNNELSNLEWCTNSYNVKHGWDSGNRTHKNNTHVLVVSKDSSFTKEYTSIRKLSEDLHVDRHRVARILKGELDNSYDYNFMYC